VDEKLKAAEVLLESKVVLVVTLVVTSLDFFLHFLITIISECTLMLVICLTEP